MREAIIARLRLGPLTATDLYRLHGFDWVVPMGALIEDGTVDAVFEDHKDALYRLRLGSEVQ